MLSEKEYKEMSRNLIKIKSLIKNEKDIRKLCKIIRTSPRLENENNYMEDLTKEQKMQIRKKLIEIATMCIDLTQLEVDFLKDINEENKLKVEKIVIEGNYEEAMEQLENADLPEEVKAFARKEIRNHFNK